MPRTACAYSWHNVEVADKVCKKFIAVRSPVNNVRAGPVNVQMILSVGKASPSLKYHSIVMLGSTCLNTSLAHA